MRLFTESYFREEQADIPLCHVWVNICNENLETPLTLKHPRSLVTLNLKLLLRAWPTSVPIQVLLLSLRGVCNVVHSPNWINAGL